jgi:hypothetical protein
MKLEIGKTYRTRDGKKAVVEFIMPEPSRYASRWIARMFSKEGWLPWTYNEDGTFGAGGGPADIVSEWIDKPEWCKGNPAWARWQAHHGDGTAYWYVAKPEIEEKQEIWKFFARFSSGWIFTNHAPVLPPGCRWQDSLVEAPEGWGK